MADDFYKAQEAYARLTRLMVEYQDAFVFGKKQPPAWLESMKQKVAAGYGCLYTAEYDKAVASFGEALDVARKNGAL